MFAIRSLFALLACVAGLATAQITRTGTILNDDSSGSTAFVHWTASSAPAQGSIAGYRVWWGSASGEYRWYKTLGVVTEASAADLAPYMHDGTVYLVVAAIDDQGFENARSSEITFTVSGVKSCTTSLSSGGNIGTALTNAAGGDHICLANGNYAGFSTSANKSSPVIIRAADGATADITSDITVTGSGGNWTLDLGGSRNVDQGNLVAAGSVQGGDLSGTISGAGAHDIVWRGFNQIGQLWIDGPTAADEFVFEDFQAISLDTTAVGDFPLQMTGSGQESPIGTVRRAYITGGCADGIRIDGPVAIEDVYIANKANIAGPGCVNDPHTDAIQVFTTNPTGTTLKRSHLHCNEQTWGSYDGSDNMLIENNLFTFDSSCGFTVHIPIELYSDDATIVRYNTSVFTSGQPNGFEFNSKGPGNSNQGAYGDDDGMNGQTYDNIGNVDIAAGLATLAVNSHNCVHDPDGINVDEDPTYVGGSQPRTFADSMLAAGGCTAEGTGGINPGHQYRGIAAPTSLGHN